MAEGKKINKLTHHLASQIFFLEAPLVEFSDQF